MKKLELKYFFLSQLWLQIFSALWKSTPEEGMVINFRFIQFEMSYFHLYISSFPCTHSLTNVTLRMSSHITYLSPLTTSFRQSPKLTTVRPSHQHHGSHLQVLLALLFLGATGWSGWTWRLEISRRLERHIRTSALCEFR